MIYIIIFLIIVILTFLFLTIKIKIQISNLNLNFPKKNKNILNKESKIYLKIYILRSIKIAQIDLKKIDLKNMKFKDNFKNFKDTIFTKKILETSKENRIQIEKMNLNINIGVEDAAITAILVGVVSGIIGILVKNKIKNQDMQIYNVYPLYQNKNTLKIYFEGIITWNMTNIIYILKLLLKRRVEENDRTSNRRPYAYSNE